MADDLCPTLIGDPAVGFTSLAFDKYTTFSTQAVGRANAALDKLTTYTIDPISFDVSFDDEGNVGTYQFPPRPDDPDITFNGVTDPPAPPTVRTADIAIDAAPTDTTIAPVIGNVPTPDVSLPAQPGPAPVLDTVIVPDAPTFADIPDPTLFAINLPTPIPLNLPTFQGQRPVFNIKPPPNSFTFTPQEYVSALLTKTQGQISTMLDGGTGLPAAVIQALRARAYAAVDIAETRAVQQVTEEFGNLGWTEPSGLLYKKVRRARQDSQNQRNGVDRDIFINDEQIAVENLRFAVGQGVALESALFAAHNEFMRVALEAASTTVRIAIETFNAQVALIELQEKAYETDAAVFRDLITAESQKIEIYRAQLEAQRVIGELNQQLVAVFNAKIQALLAKVEVYKAEVAGAQAKADVIHTVIEGRRAEIEAYAAEVGAYRDVWNAYTAQVEGQKVKADIYAVMENAFGQRVQAFKTVQDTKIAAANLKVALSDLDLRGWRGKLDLFLGKIDAEKTRVMANVGVLGAHTELYKADASIQATASEVRNRNLQLILARAQAKVDTEIKNVSLAIDQREKDFGLVLEKAKTIASVEAQVAGSAMSALSFHTGISSERSMRQGCETTFQFLGSA